MSNLIDSLLDQNPSKSILLWSDGLTSYNITIKDPQRTILAIWTDSTAQSLKDVCKKGVKVLQGLASKYYLDCGGENMFVPGPTWCNYNFWKNMYG